MSRWPRVIERGLDESWRPAAACRGKFVDLFFPPGRLPKPQRDLLALQGVKICETCPVMEECRRYAFKTRQEAGVWGGLTEEQRRSRSWRKWWRWELQREDGR